MSTRTTATGLQVTPSGAGGLTVSGGGGSSFGSWVEFLASSSGAVTVAGFTIDGGTFVGAWMEVEFGVGAAAAEVVVARTQVYGPNSGNMHPQVHLLPVPIYAGPAASRIALRFRQAASGGGVTLLLLYYDDFDSEHVTSHALAGVPTGAAGVTVTPNASAWAWSSWVELTTGIGHEIAITGISADNPVAADVEWELGIGAAAAEAGITRFRATSSNASTGSLRTFALAGALPIPPSTRVAIHMRKSGTSTTAHRAQLLYVDDTVLL